MNLKPIASNQTEVEIGDITILFSYSTPVAYHKVGQGYFRTDRFYSVTTSKHINKWLDGFPAQQVPQEQIEAILEGRGGLEK